MFRASGKLNEVWNRWSLCGIEPRRFFSADDNIRLAWICGLLAVSLRKCVHASRFSLVTRRLMRSSRFSGGSSIHNDMAIHKGAPNHYIIVPAPPEIEPKMIQMQCHASTRIQADLKLDYSVLQTTMHGLGSLHSQTSNPLFLNGPVIQRERWCLGWKRMDLIFWTPCSFMTRQGASPPNKHVYTRILKLAVALIQAEGSQMGFTEETISRDLHTCRSAFLSRSLSARLLCGNVDAWHIGLDEVGCDISLSGTISRARSLYAFYGMAGIGMGNWLCEEFSLGYG